MQESQAAVVADAPSTDLAVPPGPGYEEPVPEDSDSVADVSAGTEVPPAIETALTPSHARLGAEGVLRLRARHAEILARISERVPDATRQEELKTQAERLNPDTWVTDGEVSAGLEGYEAVLESLRAVVGQGRRRRRRGGQVRESSPAGPASPLVDNAGTAIESGPPAASAEGQDDDAEPEEEPV